MAKYLVIEQEPTVSNGYEIRLELLQMAKDILDREYASRCKEEQSIADVEKRAYKHPEIYSIEQITKKAVELNNFINQKY